MKVIQKERMGNDRGVWLCNGDVLWNKAMTVPGVSCLCQQGVVCTVQ